MAHPPKRKGNRFECEPLRQAETAGVETWRAYASNGQALGKGRETDVVLEGKSRRLTVQAKRCRAVTGY